MPINETQLANLLHQADAQFTSPRALPLAASQLVEAATVRKRRRSAFRAAGVGALLLAVATGYHWWPASRSEVTEAVTPANQLEELSAALATLEQQTDALLASVCQQPGPRFDLISALEQPRPNDEIQLARLRNELATLEARVATNDPHMAWEIAWSRSGALRLELARQEARLDPGLATESFRQIATTYAGTRWGDEAQQSLARFSGP